MSQQNQSLNFYEAAKKMANTKNKMWKKVVYPLCRKYLRHVEKSAQNTSYDKEKDLIKFLDCDYKYFIILSQSIEVSYKDKVVELFPIICSGSGRVMGWIDAESEIKNVTFLENNIIIKSKIYHCLLKNSTCCDITAINSEIVNSSIYDSKVSNELDVDNRHSIEGSYIFKSTLKNSFIMDSNINRMDLYCFDIVQNQIVFKP